MERFLTVQGEGAYTGAAAWFIRLGGCDVGCAWCDVKESWDVNAHPHVTAGTLVDEAVTSKAPICVITGGEPAMHDLAALPQGSLEAIYAQTDELKVIVVNRHDLEWGREHSSRLQAPARLYFQPEWDRREQVLDYTVAFVKENPEWRISLQTHKYLGLP